MDAWRVLLLNAWLISLQTSSVGESPSCALTRRWHVTPLKHLANASQCYQSHFWNIQGPSDQTVLFIDVHCCSELKLSSTCNEAAMDQVATREALMSGVSSLVYISTTLSCAVGSSSEGIGSEAELTNVTTYTVTDNLQGWFTAGKVAAYSASTGCLWYQKAENDSIQDLLTDLAEQHLLGWSLGWIVTIPHNASRYEVQIQKAVIAGEIKAYKGTITFESDPSDVPHPQDVCRSDTVSDPCERILKDCVHTDNMVCQLIGTVHVGPLGILAVVRTKENYQVMEYSHVNKHWMVKSTLPMLIPTFNSIVNGKWVVVEGNSTSAELPKEQSLCITQVHLVGGHILALMGKQFLLSYDQGETFYMRTGMTNGSLNSSLTLFAAREDGSFLLGSDQNETNRTFEVNLWFGHVATGDVIQIHPQPSNWWQVKAEFAADYAQCHLKLSYDNEGAHLGQSPKWDTVEDVNCNKTQDIPLSILVVSADSLVPPAPVAEATEREEEEGFGHWWRLLGSNSSAGVPEVVQEQVTTAPHSCPALKVSVQAPLCCVHTRTQFEVQNILESEWGAIRHITPWDLPQRNCSVSAPSLPPRVFLTPTHNYPFSVHVHPNPGYSEAAFGLLVITDPPDVINVTAERALQNDNITVSFDVSMSIEPNGNQFQSGTLDQAVHVMFKILGMGMKCIDPFDPASPQIEGSFQTVVHLGCPPGLRVEFNPHLSTMGQRHHCTPSAQEEVCLYFEKAFYPVFEIVDDVDGSREVFTGEYTVNTMAGGGSPYSMMSFSQLTQAMFKQDSGSSIWAPLNGDSSDPVFTSSRNGIQWVCGPKSPCAAISPHFPNSPEYFVQLVFTNSGIGSRTSSCHFSTTFIVKIHGITMGTASTVASLIVPILAMLMWVLVCFVCWKFKPRIKDALRRWRGRVKGATSSIHVPFLRRMRVHPQH